MFNFENTLFKHHASNNTAAGLHQEKGLKLSNL